jgi:hypothetical protein
MNVQLSTSDMVHIVDLLREDIAFCSMVVDEEADEQATSESHTSMDKSRVVLMKIAKDTIIQAYEPQTVASRRGLN